MSAELRNLIVSAPRGSGGAHRQLSHVMRLLCSLRPSWNVLVYASPAVRDALGSDAPFDVRPIDGDDYRSRLRWELLDLPALCTRDRSALIYAPFGPLMNSVIARQSVWMARNIIPLLNPRSWEVSDADRLRLHALRVTFAVSARRARGVICVSHHARARLSALARIPIDRISVAPHGAEDAPAAEMPLPAEVADLAGKPFLLHVGQPVPYRRSLELIEAITALAARRPDLPPIVLVGAARDVDRAYEARCIELVQPLVKAGRALALGQRAPGEALALTRRAHAVIYPSVHEDCPNVILETLAAGRVLVCADIPATRELCGNGALYVQNPTAPSLTSAIESAVWNDELRTTLSSAASRRASLYTWERTAELTARALERAHACRDRVAA